MLVPQCGEHFVLGHGILRLSQHDCLWAFPLHIGRSGYDLLIRFEVSDVGPVGEAVVQQGRADLLLRPGVLVIHVQEGTRAHDALVREAGGHVRVPHVQHGVDLVALALQADNLARVAQRVLAVLVLAVSQRHLDHGHAGVEVVLEAVVPRLVQVEDLALVVQRAKVQDVLAEHPASRAGGTAQLHVTAEARRGRDDGQVIHVQLIGHAKAPSTTRVLGAFVPARQAYLHPARDV